MLHDDLPAGPATDPRRQAPAAARNRDPIRAALRPLLPAAGLLLELASGTGEHAAHLAPEWPDLIWQPTDPDAEARASIDAWCARIPNVRPALPLDVMWQAWPVPAADAVLCVNLLHVAPWAATVSLLAGAARVLPPAAPLILYGPFRQAGRHTAESNAAFDADLRARDPAWGVRDLEAVADAAAMAGFAPPAATAMPANNLLLILRRPPSR